MTLEAFIEKHLDEMTTARMEWALENLCARLHKPPDLDAIRVFALGLAVSSTRFREKLFLDVGLRAFGVYEEAAGSLYADNIAMMMSDLGCPLKTGEPVSSAVLRALVAEDKEEWQTRHDRVAMLHREITTLLNRLAMLARVKQRPWPKEEQETPQ